MHSVLPKCKTSRVLIKHDIATHRGPCPLNGDPVCEVGFWHKWQHSYLHATMTETEIPQQCPSLSLDEGGRSLDICKGSETISQNLQGLRNMNVSWSSPYSMEQRMCSSMFPSPSPHLPEGAACLSCDCNQCSSAVIHSTLGSLPGGCSWIWGTWSWWARDQKAN